MTLDRDFIHLRVRSAYSLLEGAIKPQYLADLAKSANMPALGIADRANLFGALEISQYLKEAGIQPIIGCALPVSGIGVESLSITQKPPCVALIAKSETGWRNLMALSSCAYLDSSRAGEVCVDWKTIVKHQKDLILLSGGPDGPVNPLIVSGRFDEAAQALMTMAEVFENRFYIELQRHGLEDENLAEHKLCEIAYAQNIALVATQDVYFRDKAMYSAQDALMCIADSTFIEEDNRRRLTPEHYFKTANEMRALFADLPEACDNSVEIAKRCAFLVEKRDPILPRFPTLPGWTEAEELSQQARDGLKIRLAKFPTAAPEETYWERLDLELGVINTMGFSGYFLIVADFIKWAKSKAIPVGPGRGSGAGSLVAYALTITDLDPLKFGLLFERFLNPERVSMPDFDIDFCQERREEVISYVQDRYGKDHVAQIITFGTLQARAVLRDVGRVMQLPLGLVDRLAKMVPNNPANPVTLAQAIEIEPRFQTAIAEEDSVKTLLDIALQLEGLYRNASTHAAGIVIGDRPLQELTPLYQDPRSHLPATQYNMKWVESAGLVKFDFLGLKTLTILDRAKFHLSKRGVSVDFLHLPLDDEKTYQLLASGDTMGVFQLESQGMRETLRKMRCSSLEEITALISLYRPGPMDNIDTYISRKFGKEKIDCLHPSLEPFLRETYGVIIYQEQVMQIAQILSGYSLGEADLLRRAMGKKKKEEMDTQKARFIEGAKNNGVSQDRADYIFELVAKFAGYGFNKSHAAAYAILAYQTAWLKANHPVEFFAATMSLDLSNTDKLAVYYQDAKRLGVTIMPPDINLSGSDFEVVDGKILYALGAVRNVGPEAMKQIEEIRKTQGNFTDIFDFVERLDPHTINKRALENLARAGAFDHLSQERSQIIAASEILISHGQSVAADRLSAQSSLFSDAAIVRPRLPPFPVWTETERLDEERQAIGFYLTGHPLEDLTLVLRRRQVVFIADVLVRAETGDTGFTMAGVIRRRQERLSQSGEKFAYLSLSDPTGAFEVMVPPDILKTSRTILEVGNSVILRVKLRSRDQDLRLILEQVELIDKALQSLALNFRIHMNDPSSDLEILSSLLETAKIKENGHHKAPVHKQSGQGEVTFVLNLNQGHRVDIKIKGYYSLDLKTRGQLKAIPCVCFLEEI